MNEIYFYYPSIEYNSFSNSTIRHVSSSIKKNLGDINYLPLSFLNKDLLKEHFKKEYYEIYVKKYGKYGYKFDRTFTALNNLLIFDKERIDNIFENINVKKSLIIISLVSYFQLNHLIYLLEKGYKIIAGGSCINTMGVKKIRDFINKINPKLNNQVIFITGYADLNTNWISIIKNWKDVDIGFPDDTFYQCYYDAYDNDYSFNAITCYFIHGCSWGRCKYCDGRHFDKNDLQQYRCLKYFVNKNNLNLIINYYNDLLEKYNLKSINIVGNYIDNYLIENVLLNNNFKYDFLTYFFTGVGWLKQKKYFKNVIKLIEKVKNHNLNFLLGFETLNNWTLKVVDRNYDYSDILNVLGKLYYLYQKYNINCGFTIINDLPMQNRNEVIKNRNMYFEVLKLFNTSGIFYYNFLKLLGDENIEGIKYISKDNDINFKYHSGFYSFAKQILKKEYFERQYILKYELLKNFVRYDKNKQLIESDRYLFFDKEWKI